jgi:hypothetical protein
MSGRVADIDCTAHGPGRSARFAIAPDQDTRRMFERWHTAYGDV